MTTKERIIFESLKLFSAGGYEAVSTRMIAKAIGASDSVIYKHFKSKHEILDSIVDVCRQRFISKSSEINLETIDWSTVGNVCLEMFRFQTTDEWIVPFRRLLVIEQFKNPELMGLYKKFFVEFPLDSMSAIFTKLMEQGWMKKGNPKVFAMELYSPFFLYHTLAPVTEETLKCLEEHLKNFRFNVIADEHKEFLTNIYGKEQDKKSPER